MTDDAEYIPTHSPVPADEEETIRILRKGPWLAVKCLSQAKAAWMVRIEVEDQHTQRRKEPPVLPTRVPLLERLLHRLLGLLPLADLHERVVGDDALQAFQFERVPGWHQVVVVDDLDESAACKSAHRPRTGSSLTILSPKT